MVGGGPSAFRRSDAVCGPSFRLSSLAAFALVPVVRRSTASTRSRHSFELALGAGIHLFHAAREVNVCHDHQVDDLGRRIGTEERAGSFTPNLRLIYVGYRTRCRLPRGLTLLSRRSWCDAGKEDAALLHFVRSPGDRKHAPARSLNKFGWELRVRHARIACCRNGSAARETVLQRSRG